MLTQRKKNNDVDSVSSLTRSVQIQKSFLEIDQSQMIFGLWFNQNQFLWSTIDRRLFIFFIIKMRTHSNRRFFDETQTLHFLEIRWEIGWTRWSIASHELRDRLRFLEIWSSSIDEANLNDWPIFSLKEIFFLWPNPQELLICLRMALKTLFRRFILLLSRIQWWIIGQWIRYEVDFTDWRLFTVLPDSIQVVFQFSVRINWRKIMNNFIQIDSSWKIMMENIVENLLKYLWTFFLLFWHANFFSFSPGFEV